ncbi:MULTISPECIES: hypothetical protein [Microbacterium]|uniref:hypothetical protein n=1 Tax=Microbacterium TaxID=33882 RepID=UPI0027824D8A|nr:MULTISPECIES: hypothetical protein [Microbacterium]MDQ1083119.1 molybdopterin biosynthesis enzyme [Microbacterium sp. SORGH_AS_0344]MDQ1171609.1 molybdopterin biosynthesis enzyme [Microbacterium proteolyticum]
MSLIAVAAHLRDPRRLLHLALLSVIVIAGLLAMHALNTHSTAAGHAVATAHAPTVAHGAAPDIAASHEGMTVARAAEFDSVVSHAGAAAGRAAEFDSVVSHGGTATGHTHGGEPTASEIVSAHPAATPPRAAHDGHAPSGEHTMAWMTCVLALLAAVIAFVAAAAMRSESLRVLLRRTRPFSWSVVAHALPPPSLTVLCIRRT